MRDPEKPTWPALDQEITLPRASVIEIMVLLNVAWIWATPDALESAIRFFLFLPDVQRARLGILATMQGPRKNARMVLCVLMKLAVVIHAEKFVPRIMSAAQVKAARVSRVVI